MSNQEFVTAAEQANQALIQAMICPQCLAAGRGEKKLHIAGVASLDPVDGVRYKLECADKNPCGFTTTMR